MTIVSAGMLRSTAARRREARARLFEQILTPVASVVAALLLMATIIAAIGADPIVALVAILNGAFGSANNFATTLAKTCPLLIAGVGIAFALKARLFNIGAEGQIYVGALAGTWLILTFSLSGPIGLIAGLVAGVLGGAAWAAIAGWLRAQRSVNEVITTLLLNYVGIQLVLWAVSGPMFAAGATFPRSEDIPWDALLPSLIPRTQGHIGILFGLAGAFLCAWLLQYTVFGYRVRALQLGEDTPRYAGMKVKRLIVVVLGSSGGMAGLAGMVEVLGVHRRLVEGFSPGYGFDALAVALLARGNPIAVIPAALFFGILRAGANAMQRATGVPSSMVFVIQGSAVLIVIAGYALEAILRKRRAARAVLSAHVSSPEEGRA